MNKAIELHDSILFSVNQKNGTAILHFDKAYVHQSEGKPGIDSGTGWLQSIDLEIAGTVIESMPKDLPVDLDDGYLVVHSTKTENFVDLPINMHGDIELQFMTASGEELKLTGKHISSIEKSELEYVEDYNA